MSDTENTPATQFVEADEAFVEPTVENTEANVRRPDRATRILLSVAAFVAVGGLAFAFGRLSAPGGSGSANGLNDFRNGAGRNVPAFAPNQSGLPGLPGGFPGNGADGDDDGRGLHAGTGVTGIVESASGTTLTVKLANGSSVTVALNGATTYHGTTTATSSDVKAGSVIVVQADQAAGGAAGPGAQGQPGTITAKDILITNP
jgi:hypothetical protein